MSRIAISLTGAGISKSTIKNSGKLPIEEVRKRCDAFCREVAEAIVTEEESNAPVDSGTMASSYVIVPVRACSYEVHNVATNEEGIPYWQFVEYGTGVVGQSAASPHAGDAGWVYDVHGHGTDGWVYYKDGSYHWTAGQLGKNVLYNAVQVVNKQIPKIWKKYFS